MKAMGVLPIVFICSLVGALVSLTGGVWLLTRKKSARAAEYATAFAAGALLVAAFADLLPEALEQTEAREVMVFVLVGILVFFVLESFIHWFHHHGYHDDCPRRDGTVPMIIVGDTLHNFIDGIAIAAGFLVDIQAGIIVTVAVMLHEVPQEVGDFGFLLRKGVGRKNVLLVNFFSSLAACVSAVVFYIAGERLNFNLAPALAIVAGFFIYIAVSDIIPSIHKTESRRRMAVNSLVMLGAIVLMFVLTSLLHGVE